MSDLGIRRLRVLASEAKELGLHYAMRALPTERGCGRMSGAPMPSSLSCDGSYGKVG